VALETAEQSVVVGERLGLAKVVAEALVIKGIVYFYRGRLWEARAVLEGARIIAQNFSLPDVELRAIHNLGLGFALDDARAAVELERQGIELARRIGERATEVILIGNATEDGRRTGDWTWALEELDTAIGLDIDAASRRALLLVRATYHALQGRMTDADLAELDRTVEGMEDADIDAGVHDIRAALAIADGEWRRAYDEYTAVADGSLLNAPYVMPSAGWMAVLARDPDLARTALERLRSLGTRGRAIEAGRGAVIAGIAALEGDKAAALTGFRQSINALRELGLPLDEAFVVMVAVSCLGAGEPETLGWATRSADFLDEVGAEAVARQLERLVDTSTSLAPRTTSARSTVGSPSEAQASGS
jgi:hypothetical protein